MRLFFTEEAPVMISNLSEAPTFLFHIRNKLIASPQNRSLLFSELPNTISESDTTHITPITPCTIPLRFDATPEEKRTYMVRILAYHRRGVPRTYEDSEIAVEADRLWATPWQLQGCPHTRITDYESLLHRLIGEPQNKMLYIRPEDTFRWGGVIRQYIYEYLCPLAMKIHDPLSHHPYRQEEAKQQQNEFISLLEHFSSQVDMGIMPYDAFPGDTGKYHANWFGTQEMLQMVTKGLLKFGGYDMVNILGNLVILETFHHTPTTHLHQDTLITKMRAHLFAILDRVLESEFRRAFGKTLSLAKPISR